MLLGRILCQLMKLLQTKTGNPLAFVFGFSLFLLLLCLPNISNKYYHDTVSDQLYAQHKGGILGVVWENVVSSYGSATA